MSTPVPLPAARQAAVLVAIAALHVAALVLVAAGLRSPASVFRDWQRPVYATPPPPEPVRETRPDPVRPMDVGWEPVEQPDVPFPQSGDPPQATTGAPERGTGETGSGAPVAAPVVHGPALRTRDARLQALIDNCYPSAARRLGQEGQGVARVVVGAGGRAIGWSVEQSTGFAPLDPGMGCVAQRVLFEPGRRDGRAVEATVLMPITFRLD